MGLGHPCFTRSATIRAPLSPLSRPPKGVSSEATQTLLGSQEILNGRQGTDSASSSRLDMTTQCLYLNVRINRRRFIMVVVVVLSLEMIFAYPLIAMKEGVNLGQI